MVRCKKLIDQLRKNDPGLILSMLKAIACFRIILAMLFTGGVIVAGLNITVWTALSDEVAPLLLIADRVIVASLRVPPDSIPNGVTTLFILLLFAVTILYFASGVILLKTIPVVSVIIIRIQIFHVLMATSYSLFIYFLHGVPGPDFSAGFLFSIFPILLTLFVAIETCLLWKAYRGAATSSCIVQAD